MRDINIIIIGAMRSNYKGIPNDYKTWNNHLQADYYDIVEFIQTLYTKNHCNITVKCIDPQYNQNIKDPNYDIHYIDCYYSLGDTTCCSMSGHNIFIEFSNLLDEYYVTKTKTPTNQSENISKYNNFIVTWLSCGCEWDKRFPKDLLMTVILNENYTPTDMNNEESYLTTMQFNQQNNLPSLYKPYSIGLYQILGSLHWRGYKDNYEYENVLYKVVERFLKNINEKIHLENHIHLDLQRFCNHDIHWNNLSRATRDFMQSNIYGPLIS